MEENKAIHLLWMSERLAHVGRVLGKVESKGGLPEKTTLSMFFNYNDKTEFIHSLLHYMK